MIDDKYGSENISNAFADKYRELCHSVPFDKNIMAKILIKLSGKINNECLSKNCYSLPIDPWCCGVLVFRAAQHLLLYHLKLLFGLPQP